MLYINYQSPIARMALGGISSVLLLLCQSKEPRRSSCRLSYIKNKESYARQPACKVGWYRGNFLNGVNGVYKLKDGYVCSDVRLGNLESNYHPNP